MLHAYLAALALATTTLATSGCGGSSKTDAPTTAAVTTTSSATTAAATTGEPITIASGKPLSRSTWIAKGDKICTRANVKLDSTIIRTKQDFARVLPQAASYDHIEAVELSKLVPPAALADDWKQVVNGFQKFGEETAVGGERAQNNELDVAQSIFITARATQERFTKIAKRDGFKVCSGP
jgi:hypothetical protein